MNEKHKKTYDFFINDGFTPLDAKSYPLVQEYRHCSPLLEKNITALIMWHNILSGLYKVIDGCLCSVFFIEGEDIFWTIHRPEENSTYPLQPIIDLLCELCKKAKLPFLRISVVDKFNLAEYEAVEGHTIQTDYCIDNSEYVYKTADLLDLSGPINYNKRKAIKIFADRDDISIKPITNSNMQLCLEVEETWCKKQDCSQCRSFFGCDKDALKNLIDIFNDKIHSGLLLYDNDKPAGYILYEKINKEYSFLYNGKSLLEYGFVYLIYIIYKDYLKDVEHMNASEDVGHPGLRKFKQMLSRHELWHRYIVTYGL